MSPEGQESARPATESDERGLQASQADRDAQRAREAKYAEAICTWEHASYYYGEHHRKGGPAAWHPNSVGDIIALADAEQAALVAALADARRQVEAGLALADKWERMGILRSMEATLTARRGRELRAALSPATSDAPEATPAPTTEGGEPA